MARTSAALVVAALVLLAGCSGLGGSSQTGAQPTERESPPRLELTNTHDEAVNYHLVVLGGPNRTIVHDQIHEVDAGATVVLDDAVGDYEEFAFRVQIANDTGVDAVVEAGEQYHVTIHGQRNVTVQNVTE